ncbi:hypothetical protein [Amycolatopsis sp. lyj-23]|uniref:hypothetical protein n=1 Tax=Amycolatopsis sp. lyj-23 TaxID=2789283 RepID=UPI00397D6D62
MNETDEHSGQPEERRPSPAGRRLLVPAAAVAGLAVVVAVVLVQSRFGQSSSAPSSAPRTSATRPPANTTSTSGPTPSGLEPSTPAPDNIAVLNDFAAACDKGVNDWRAAQVDYAGTLDLVKDVPGVYVAAIDVNNLPLPPDKVIPGSDPRTAPIGVQCVISARVIGDESMTVSPLEWAPRAFNPAGVMNWSWQVTARAPGSRRLQLQLQPAVATDGAAPRIIIGGAPLQTLTYVTQVVVAEPPPPERGFGEVISDNWAAFSAAVAAIGAAVLSLVRWGGRLGTELRRLSTAWGRRKPAKTGTIAPKASKKKSAKKKD